MTSSLLVVAGDEVEYCSVNKLTSVWAKVVDVDVVIGLLELVVFSEEVESVWEEPLLND